MNKKVWMTLVVFFAAATYWSSKLLIKKTDSKDKPTITKVEGLNYWTCPMHPQIHSDKPGECPICHMKLIQVKEQAAHAHQETEDRSQVMTSSDQRQLLGIQRNRVEKMTLTFHIPVSGRFISSSNVAFQVYEADLRYVKSGLAFTGESSFFPESEISGTVSSVDSIVDPTSRTVRVVGSVRKGPRGLISETTFRGELAIELKDVIAIPESSVLHTGTGSLVYVLDDTGGMTATTVKLGLKTESYYEVLSGIQPGQFISSGPNFLIDSEAKIRGTSGHSNH